MNSGCLVHGHGLCYECSHNNLCGGVQREGCDTMKIGDVEKLVKVVIETHGKFLLQTFHKKRLLFLIVVLIIILFGQYLIIFYNGLKTKTESIQTAFKNAIAEVERNTNAILETLMKKACFQISFLRNFQPLLELRFEHYYQVHYRLYVSF